MSWSYVSNEDVSCNPHQGARTPKAITVSSANIRDAGARRENEREREGERNVLPARALQKVVSSVTVLIDTPRAAKRGAMDLSSTVIKPYVSAQFSCYNSLSCLCLSFSSLPPFLSPPPSHLPLSPSLSPSPSLSLSPTHLTECNIC